MQADNKSRTKRLLFAALALASQLASAHDGVVSTSHPAASAAGARMLAQGGNAIDAAAAIQFALNVVEPQSSGIGGGGFMMIYLARDREIVIVDSRERAPGPITLRPRVCRWRSIWHRPAGSRLACPARCAGSIWPCVAGAQ